MTMKKYVRPIIEVIELECDYVITTSESGKLDVSDTPGGGNVDMDYSEI